jgi:uncharacterized membrane-anchored protein
MGLRFKIALAWVVLQVLFFIGWSGYEQRRLRPGEGISIVVRVRPLDPRDYLSGQYFQFGYDFSRRSSFPQFLEAPEGGDIWAVLGPGQGENAGFYVPVRASVERPSDLARDEVAIHGHVARWRYDFGVEKYYVPEGTETPPLERLTVRLRVGADGSARIEEVYLDGKRWP